MIALLALATLAQGGRSQALQAYVTVDAPVIAITNVTLIDGTGGLVKTGQNIVIRGNKIAAVGPAASTPAPSDAKVVEGTGHTVIPGMFGLHDHLFYTAGGGRYVQATSTAPKLYLASGVTTIRTTGSANAYGDSYLKGQIDRGETPGPRIHLTAPYLTGAANKNGSMAIVNTPEDARRFVRYWHDEGATWIKFYTDIKQAEAKAAIDEAHKLGMKVTGHICSITFQEAVALGFDNIEHGMLTATDFYEGKTKDVCSPDSFAKTTTANPTGP